MNLTYRSYGTPGNPVAIVLHGGPAARGSAAAIAQGLAESFRAYEPFQRGSSDIPLTVNTPIEDLFQFIQELCPDTPPALAGESWGAMLALAYGAAHPETVKSITLIGCGTFDKESRAEFKRIIDSRITEVHKKSLEAIEQKNIPQDEKLMAKYQIIQKAYDYDLLPHGNDTVGGFDAKAHTETWDDMLLQQERGLYPQSFTNIKCPAAMIHGDYDPHPGLMIYNSLLPYIPQLQYHALEKCGHSPWYEAHARDSFFNILKRCL
jgi:pimeloyl-ACP methyl ester carboxylesterase